MAKQKQSAANPAEEVVDPAEMLSDQSTAADLEAKIDGAFKTNSTEVESSSRLETAFAPEGMGSFESFIPVFVGEIDRAKHGYLSARLDCELTGELGDAFRRLLLGLRLSHATYVYNGRVHHVDVPVDVMRWMMTELAKRLAERPR